MVELLNYRFVEEEFSSFYIPDNSTANTLFNGEWASAYQFMDDRGISNSVTSWSNPSYHFVNAYGFAPAFKFYASSCYNGDYRPYYAFTNQYRDGRDYCAVSKNVYPSASDPYIIGIEFCHTTAKFESFTFKLRAYAPTQMAKDIEILGSKDGVNFTSLVKYTNTVFTVNATFNVPIPVNKQDWYKAYRFKTTSSSAGSGYVHFGYITPVGKWKSYRLRNLPLFEKGNVNTTSPANGADISAPIKKNKTTFYGAYGDIFNPYRTNIKCKVPNKSYQSSKTIRKYYKKHTFTRPNITSDGIVGVSNFACFAYDNTGAYYKWRCFDGTTSSHWRCSKGDGAYIGWYYEYPLNITSFTWTNYYSAPTHYRVQVSHNGEEWKDIYVGTNNNVTSGSSWTADISSNKDYYRYYRIYVDTINRDVTHCYEIAMQGTYLVESTSSNYDVYIDSNDYLLDWQISDGSYRLTNTGISTFTVPRGVKTIFVESGAVSGSPSSQYLYNEETGDQWCYGYRVDEGDSESSYWKDYYGTNYVRVTSGKTYTLRLSSSDMASFPLISWSKAINNTTPTLDNQ